jgi:hypothetical protein
MAVPSVVWSSYEKVLTAVSEAAILSDCGDIYYRPAVASYFSDNGLNKVFECYLFLKNWKWRPGSTTERLDIVVHAIELLSKDAAVLEKSSVEVSYYEQVNGGTAARLLHTTHFDFCGYQDCHPLFHAQQTPKAVIPPPTEVEEIRFTLKWDNQTGRCFKNARIPTSDMSLPSVLLSLAADHIEKEHFVELRETLKQAQGNLPRPNFVSISDSMLREPLHFRCLHWHAHMP